MNEKKVKYYTYQFDMRVLNVLAILLFLVVSALAYLIEKNNDYVFVSSIWLFLGVFVWMVLHEILHGIGFSLFSEVDRKNIVFGMALEKSVFYCMCKQVISKKVILTSLVFPVFFIGIVTLLVGMIMNCYLLVFLSIVNITGSIGDIVMIIYFLRVGNVRYLDLDDCTTFTVLSENDLFENRVLGIRLVDSGVYDENMVAQDRKRIQISKKSCYILFVCFIIIIIIGLIGGI